MAAFSHRAPSPTARSPSPRPCPPPYWPLAGCGGLKPSAFAPWSGNPFRWSGMPDHSPPFLRARPPRPVSGHHPRTASGLLSSPPMRRVCTLFAVRFCLPHVRRQASQQHQPSSHPRRQGIPFARLADYSALRRQAASPASSRSRLLFAVVSVSQPPQSGNPCRLPPSFRAVRW